MATRIWALLVVVVWIASGCGGAGVSYRFGVSGTITDATALIPLAGAVVSVTSGSSVLGTATTNAVGAYTLSGLASPAPTVTWSVSAAGFRAFSTSLSVSGGGSFTVDYAMARQIGAVSGTISPAPTSAASGGGSLGLTISGVRTLRNRPVHVPDRLAVRMRPGVQTAALQSVHQSAGAQLLKVIAPLNVHVVRVTPGGALRAMAAYRASGLIEYVEQDGYVYALAVPNDPGYGAAQWHYPAVNLPAAWDVTTGSAAVIVAVVDSGIRSHPDLTGITVQGRDTFSDDNDPTDPGCSLDLTFPSHGMHVAGTIAAVTNNSVGVAGVNWGGVAGTKIMPIRVLGETGGQCGVGTETDVADAIVYAADHGAKVVNLSLGGTAASTTLEDAVNYAVGRGVTVVAAAGNDNGPVSFPAAYSNVIAVAATDCNNAKASYSNFGPEVDVAAPGADSAVTCGGNSNTRWIWSPSWSPSAGNTYFGMMGTSMATPHVAGVAALMISRGITGPGAIQAALQSTATDFGVAGRDDFFGYGLINAAAAVGGGAASARLRAFWGDLGGGTLTVRSDIVDVAANGAFLITNAHGGTRSVFAWQDFNGDGVINPGDYFGQTSGVVVADGVTTTGVPVSVQLYSGAAVTPQSVLTIRRSP
ncbi:MAG TPA: S8 family serine peptidase [Gemmatimonadales bacterium]|nr:S8 family serine peptidase [Gemmatimonadales bacterium]